MDTNTKEVVEQFGAKLDSYIQVLAEKLGVAAEYVYPLFVKQQVIEGIWFFSALFFFFAISSFAIYYGMKEGAKQKWKDGPYLISLVPGIIIFALCLIGMAMGGSESLTKIINPEYAAIKELVRMVK